MAPIALTDAEIEAARDRGKQIAERPSAIVDVHVSSQRALCLRFMNGTRLEIPLSEIAELSSATDEQLRHIVVSPMRDAISVTDADVDIYVPGLIADVLKGNFA